MSNRTEQLLQHVLIPKVVQYYDTFRGLTQYSLKADLSNIRYVNAEFGNFGTAVFSNIALGTPDGNMFLGLDANAGVDPQQPNSNVKGTTGLGVGVAKVANDICDNVFVGWNVANSAAGVWQSVAIGAKAGEQLFNVSGGVYLGYNAGRFLSDPNVSSVDTVAIGKESSYSGKGSYNVLVGARTGVNLSGSSNVFLGNRAGSTCNATGKFLLANDVSSTLLYGVFPGNSTNSNAYLGVGMDVAGTDPYQFNVSGGTQTTGPLYVGGSFSNANGYILDVSGGMSSRSHFAGDVFIDGNLTVSGGPIGSDLCTGQIILGRGVGGPGGSNYPSLVALEGGLNVCSGFLQINYPRTVVPTYRLDVSGDARITKRVDLGSNLNVSGATVLSNTLTWASVSGSYGVFSNQYGGGRLDINTSNVNGRAGVTLYGDTTGPFAAPQAGGLVVVNNVSGFTKLQAGISNYGGVLTESNNSGLVTASLGAAGASQQGYLTLANSAGTPTLSLDGVLGAISNSNTSSNRIGGLSLSAGIIYGDGSGLSNLSSGGISGGGNGVYGGVQLSGSTISAVDISAVDIYARHGYFTGNLSASAIRAVAGASSVMETQYDSGAYASVLRLYGLAPGGNNLVTLGAPASSTQGSYMVLRSPSAQNTVEIASGNGSTTGGSVTLRNSAGAERATLLAAGSNLGHTSSFLGLSNISNRNTVAIGGNGGLNGTAIADYNAGIIVLADNQSPTPNQAVILTADGGLGGGGAISLKNTAGAQTIRLQAQDSGSNGNIAVNNSGGINTIECRGSTGTVFATNFSALSNITSTSGVFSGNGSGLTNLPAPSGGNSGVYGGVLLQLQGVTAPGGIISRFEVLSNNQTIQIIGAGMWLFSAESQTNPGGYSMTWRLVGTQFAHDILSVGGPPNWTVANVSPYTYNVYFTGAGATEKFNVAITRLNAY